MASPAAQLNQILTTTLANATPKLTDNIFRKVRLLAWLNLHGRSKQDGGDPIKREVIFAPNSTVKSQGPLDPFDLTVQGGIGHALYDWKLVTGSVVIPKTDILKNSGKGQLINLVTAKVNQLDKSFEAALGAMVYADGTGNGSLDMLGLAAIVDDTSDLGGFDVDVDATWWVADVEDAVLDLTDYPGVETLNSMYTLLDSYGATPDGEFCDLASFNAYDALMIPELRFVDTRMGDLGFMQLAHKQTPVVYDPDCPSNTWYELNSDSLEFVQHSQRWMENTGFRSPINQDITAATVLCMGNLVTSHRRGNGVFTNVVNVGSGS